MDVADLSDFYAVEAGGQVGDDGVAAGDVKPVAFDFAGVNRESQCAQGTQPEKAAPGEVEPWGRRRETGHGFMVSGPL